MEGERLVPFDPTLLPRDRAQGGPSSSLGTGSGWETIPEGRRNALLASIGGSLRKQGMDAGEIGRVLLGLNQRYCTPPLEMGEIAEIARSVGRYDADPDEIGGTIEVVGPGIPLISLADMPEPPPTTWLWAPYVPDNLMTLVAGREGRGKGLFCAHLAACVTRGATPDGEVRTPKPVLWLSSEDNEEDIWRRLRAAGWDPAEHENVHMPRLDHSIVLPEDLPEIDTLIRARDYGLVIMDPGRGYIGSRQHQTSYNNEADLRPALVGVANLAREAEVPLLFVGHAKKGDGPVEDSVSGSLAFMQVVRHALVFMQIEDYAAHAFAVAKSNAGSTGHVTGYDIELSDRWRTAYWVRGKPFPEYSSLGRWKSAMTQTDGAIALDWPGIVGTWCENNVAAGARLPKRDDLMEATGASQAQLKTAIATLRSQGRVESGPGVPSVWRG